MTNLKNTDLSSIRDEDLNPEQKDELQRRFNNFFGSLIKGKEERKNATKKKNVRKWVPGEK